MPPEGLYLQSISTGKIKSRTVIPLGIHILSLGIDSTTSNTKPTTLYHNNCLHQLEKNQ